MKLEMPARHQMELLSRSAICKSGIKKMGLEIKIWKLSVYTDDI